MGLLRWMRLAGPSGSRNWHGSADRAFLNIAIDQGPGGRCEWLPKGIEVARPGKEIKLRARDFAHELLHARKEKEVILVAMDDEQPPPKRMRLLFGQQRTGAHLGEPLRVFEHEVDLRFALDGIVLQIYQETWRWMFPAINQILDVGVVECPPDAHPHDMFCVSASPEFHRNDAAGAPADDYLRLGTQIFQGGLQRVCRQTIVEGRCWRRETMAWKVRVIDPHMVSFG